MREVCSLIPNICVDTYAGLSECRDTDRVS